MAKGELLLFAVSVDYFCDISICILLLCACACSQSSSIFIDCNDIRRVFLQLRHLQECPMEREGDGSIRGGQWERKINAERYLANELMAFFGIFDFCLELSRNIYYAPSQPFWAIAGIHKIHSFICAKCTAEANTLNLYYERLHSNINILQFHFRPLLLTLSLLQLSVRDKVSIHCRGTQHSFTIFSFCFLPGSALFLFVCSLAAGAFLRHT